MTDPTDNAVFHKIKFPDYLVAGIYLANPYTSEYICIHTKIILFWLQFEQIKLTDQTDNSVFHKIKLSDCLVADIYLQIIKKLGKIIVR